MTHLLTTRLSLEPFRDEHLPGLHAMNADPEVMRYIAGRPETLEETAAMVERVKLRWAEFGYSWWSFIERDSGELVGAGAIQNLRREATPQPDPTCPLEIGWRLRETAGNRGWPAKLPGPWRPSPSTPCTPTSCLPCATRTTLRRPRS